MCWSVMDALCSPAVLVPMAVPVVHEARRTFKSKNYRWRDLIRALSTLEAPWGIGLSQFSFAHEHRRALENLNKASPT